MLWSLTSHQWPEEDGSDWGSQSAPAPNRFSVLLDSEGHARHASAAATTNQDVPSIIPLSPIPIRSDSQVEVASVVTSFRFGFW